MESWKKYFPDYRIIEWNEDNFNINICEYTKEAYKNKKYAFVSDYARFYALYLYGGIYFDTDIEVIKDPKFLFKNHAFIGGFEDDEYILTAFFASIPKLEMWKSILDTYNSSSFYLKNGKMNLVPNPVLVTKELKKYGLHTNGKEQLFENGIIYPWQFFSGYNIAYQQLQISNETYIVHHCEGSWQTSKERIKPLIKSILLKTIGMNNFERLKKKYYLKKEEE